MRRAGNLVVVTLTDPDGETTDWIFGPYSMEVADDLIRRWQKRVERLAIDPEAGWNVHIGRRRMFTKLDFSDWLRDLTEQVAS